MSTGSLIEIFGTIAGVGGLALGVFLLLFKDVIRKKIFPTLTKKQAYRLLCLILILVWTITITGLIIWAYSTTNPTTFSGDFTEILKEDFSEALKEYLDPNNQKKTLVHYLDSEASLPSSKDVNDVYVELVRSLDRLRGAVTALGEQPNYSDAMTACQWNRISSFLLYSYESRSANGAPDWLEESLDWMFQEMLEVLKRHPEVPHSKELRESTKRRYEYFKLMREKGPGAITPRMLEVMKEL